MKKFFLCTKCGELAEDSGFARRSEAATLKREKCSICGKEAMIYTDSDYPRGQKFRKKGGKESERRDIQCGLS